MKIQHRLTASVVAALFVSTAFAARAGLSDPLDPTIPVPPSRYQSTFADYAPHSVSELGAWREQNGLAAASGGHAGHSMGPDSVTEPPSPGAPSTSGHHGKHHH